MEINIHSPYGLDRRKMISRLCIVLIHALRKDVTRIRGPPLPPKLVNPHAPAGA